MQEFNLRNFWWGNVSMWIKWIKPTSSLIAKISFIAMLTGAGIWALSRVFSEYSQQLSNIANAIGFWIFWAGIFISLLMLIFWAPYKRWKEAAPEIVEAQKKIRKILYFHI